MSSLRSKSRSLLKILRVNTSDAAGHVFEGSATDFGWGRVYGGSTMAQGLSAMQQMIGPSRSVHGFCSWFMRSGQISEPISYNVEELHSGRSFSTVHLSACQSNRPLMAMTASLAKPEEGFEHQDALRPEWGRPECFKSLREYMEPHLDSRVPARMRPLYRSRLFDIRPTEFFAPWDATVRAPEATAWIRAASELADEEDSDGLDVRLLAFISDWGLLSVALNAHPMVRSCNTRTTYICSNMQRACATCM